ncbi:MAG: hypothetical protein QOJ36_274, partial [Verrucomicrobiota bacterium]
MSYRVAPIFLIRLAGGPFECIEQLATPETCALGRELVTSQTGSDDANKAQLAHILEIELASVRAKLWKAARTVLAPYLVFAGAGARELLRHLLDFSRAPNLSHRNARAGDRERHLLLYLQRVAAKDDTFSEFGPSGWGTIGKNISGVTLAPEPGIAKRETFLERWIAHAIAAAINTDSANSNPKLAVPALEPHAVEVLLRDVENWLPSSVRDKWLSILQALVDLPLKFAATSDLQDRQSIIDQAQTSLQAIGAGPKQAGRFLYAA